MIQLPATLLAELDALVAQGMFPSRDVAVTELIRMGLEVLKARPAAPRPPAPPLPPGVRDPGDDRPISVNPGDVNWMP